MTTELIIKNSPGKGNGLFSQENIPTNHIILKFVGIPIIRKDIPDFSGAEAACLLQIGEELYLDIKGHPSYFVNHSCNPNCKIQIAVNTAFLVSVRPIAIDEELTFDYSTTSTENEDTWVLNCNCSLFGCRRKITGFHSLTDKQKEKHLTNGTVPYYLGGK
jgi:SET domain-containing protein